jgi:hypothetical protein
MLCNSFFLSGLDSLRIGDAFLDERNAFTEQFVNCFPDVQVVQDTPPDDSTNRASKLLSGSTILCISVNRALWLPVNVFTKS